MASRCFEPPCRRLASRGLASPCLRVAIYAVPLRIVACPFKAMPSPNCSILCHCWSIQCKSFAAQLDSVLCNSPANLIRGMQFLSGSTQCYALANLCEAFRSPCYSTPFFAVATLFTSWLSLCYALHTYPRWAALRHCQSVRSMLVNAFACPSWAFPLPISAVPGRAVLCHSHAVLSNSMPWPFIAPHRPAVPLQCHSFPCHAWLCLCGASPHHSLP